jgi:hypothetical protein
VAVAADESPMTAPGDLGSIVVRIVVGSLLVAGAAACVALLGGGFGDVDLKIIATSTLLALVSATAGSGLAVRHRHPLLGIGTTVVSLLVFALVLIGLWPEIDGGGYWRLTGCLAIVGLEGAHASFVLSRRRDSDPASVVAATRIAVVAAAVSGVMGVLPTAGATSDSIEAVAYAQALGVVLVIQLVSTAVAPLLRRLGADAAPSRDVALTQGERLADEIAATADRIERIAAHPMVADECERLRRLARSARAF